MPVTGDRPRAHPRLRGENLKIGGLFLVAWGSSPLTRGKHCMILPTGRPVRLIPTHAGKTPSPRLKASRSRDHPRSRGKNHLGSCCSCSWVGSSPITRGKRPDVRRLLRRTGIIPAHAGKTRRGALSALCLPDHPRSRGENVTTVIASPGSPGSSPLTRGKQCEAPGLHEDAGIIPAHAGKTSPTCNATPTTWAHPHSRGENTISSTEPITLGGSSPLTRGKPHRDRVLGHEGGLIPTHTRKTSCPDSSPSPTRAHPRSRGENASNFYVPFQSQGSSPLTRGKPGDRASDRLPRRLIPAHAGKTVRFRRLLARSRAHPRSRRENKQLLVTAASQRGSSPLTRGKHRAVRRAGRQRGLIPTHAGKTPKVLWRRLPRWAHPRPRGDNVTV